MMNSTPIARSAEVSHFPSAFGAMLAFGKRVPADPLHRGSWPTARPVTEGPQLDLLPTWRATLFLARVAISPARVQLAGERESRRHVHGPDIPERARLAPTLSRFEVTPHD